MVMPRSRSMSMESSSCASMSLSATVPVRLMRVSASVDLPWSMCAMMEKLRMFLAGTWSTAFGSILTLSPFLLGTTGVSAARTRTARLPPESRGRRVGKNLADASPPPPSRARARARAAPSVATRAAEGAMPDIALGSSALNPTIGGGTNRLPAPSAVSVQQSPTRTCHRGLWFSGLERARPILWGLSDRFHRVLES